MCLTWLTDLIKVSLDPLLPSACVRCSDLISQLLDYDISDAQLAPLLEVLLNVFCQEIDAICIPVVKQPQPVADASADDVSRSGIGRSFLLRQLHRLLMVLQNLLLFRDFLSPQVLMRVVWTTLTTKCLAPILKVLSAADFKV